MVKFHITFSQCISTQDLAFQNKARCKHLFLSLFLKYPRELIAINYLTISLACTSESELVSLIFLRLLLGLVDHVRPLVAVCWSHWFGMGFCLDFSLCLGGVLVPWHCPFPLHWPSILRLWRETLSQYHLVGYSLSGESSPLCEVSRSLRQL